jgi:alkyl sulfatase BDS1-like metallo-beta-lactamase superfamily hydrolase
VRVDADADAGDRQRLAACLRTIAQRTPAANIRNWCLTRALFLDGSLDLSRLYRHRFSRAQVLGSPPDRSVHILRVLVDPEFAHGINLRLAWHFSDGSVTGLHLRNSVACPTDGADPQATVVCSIETWAELLTGRLVLSAALGDGSVVIEGDATAAIRALGAFDVDGLRA